MNGLCCLSLEFYRHLLRITPLKFLPGAWRELKNKVLAISKYYLPPIYIDIVNSKLISCTNMRHSKKWLYLNRFPFQRVLAFFNTSINSWSSNLQAIPLHLLSHLSYRFISSSESPADLLPCITSYFSWPPWLTFGIKWSTSLCNSYPISNCLLWDWKNITYQLNTLSLLIIKHSLLFNFNGIHCWQIKINHKL